MLNKIWPIMIIISVIFGLFTGRISEVNDAIFVSFSDTINMGLDFLGVMCFWSGIIQILKNTEILVKIKKILRPFINKFFSSESEKSKELISLNMVSNLIGIGNAATPIGIETMKELDKSNNSNHLSYGMNMFLLINTLSIQIIPTTIISVRTSLNSEMAGRIIIPVWITSVLTFIIMITIGSKILKKEKDNEHI